MVTERKTQGRVKRNAKRKIKQSRREPEYNYLVDDWKGLIKELVGLVARGYYYYHVEILPAKKREKWPLIDEKLIAKYCTRKSKDQRFRAKKNGIANFFYLRWEDIVVILHTLGEVCKEIVYDDKFFDVRRRPMPIDISSETRLVIKADTVVQANEEGNKTIKEKATCEMAPKMLAEVKAALADHARSKNIRSLIWEFRKLNGLPAYSGVNAQKFKLKKFIIKQGKLHQLALSPDMFPVFTYRSPKQIVWKREEAGPE